ncbi:hypothetical protein [Prosthecobacter sp.]|uniref:hypothetical protein n=1 Tax=Prosthecobacter sp. TaxID=1965333 RepID=UPI002ABA936C|nr:hypothetical protein [Prosthecobacter sp.]MDZ4402415.1 hypothetical protein [Prosthecobacter sp.]
MLRRITSKRVTRVLLWIFITLVTLIVLLFVWTNWSGKRRWAAVQAMIEREGETLDFRKLLPATPPEAENLLAIEPLRGIAMVIDGDESRGDPGAKRKALEAMKWDAKGKLPAASGVTLGQAAGMASWVKFLREAKFLNLPVDSSTPGRDVLNALDVKFPLLKQLTDELPKRSQAMFTPGLRERELPELLFSLRVPHYAPAQTLARMLGLRARAALEAKESHEATRSILVARSLGAACESEPLLIGFLVGLTADANATEAVWQGLRERAFAADNLRLLQDAFATHDIDKALLLAMRGEMAAGLSSLAYLQDAAAGRKKASEDMADALSGDGTGLTLNAYRAVPGGLFDHWKSVVAEMELRHLIQPLKKGEIAGAVSAGEALDREIMEKRNFLLHADHIMARLMVPAVKQVSAHALLAQVRARQAMTAIALERFYLKHSRYPALLDELVPEFLPAVPLDPCDGKALRYRVNNNGRYTLWSVAFDGKDDAGKVNPTADLSAMKKAGYLGDWAWQYEPVK